MLFFKSFWLSDQHASMLQKSNTDSDVYPLNVTMLTILVQLVSVLIFASYHKLNLNDSLGCEDLYSFAGICQKTHFWKNQILI